MLVINRSVRDVDPQLGFTGIILFLLVFQTLHVTDHILQYIQKVTFGIEEPPGLYEGLLNASDTTIHLILNAIEFASILLIWIVFRIIGPNQLIVKKSNGKFQLPLFANLVIHYIILFLLVFQTLHVTDHILQYIQKVTFGIEGPPGLFQGIFNETDTVVHLWINLIIMISLLVIWLLFRELQVAKSTVNKEKKLECGI